MKSYLAKKKKLNVILKNFKINLVQKRFFLISKNQTIL